MPTENYSGITKQDLIDLREDIQKDMNSRFDKLEEKMEITNMIGAGSP